jgi:hypothetical protein
MAWGGVDNGLAQVEGEQQRHGRGQEVAAPLVALPHGGSRDQLGQAEQDQPDRDRAAMVQQRRQVAVDQSDKAVAGILAQLLSRQPREGCWESKLGIASSTPTRISLRPRAAL